MNHINSKVLLGLGTAAALAVVVAAMVSSSRQPLLESSKNAAYALPELRDHVNDVKTLNIVAAEDKALVTLQKGDKGWSVREKGGYPANVGKLRELLLNLSDARLLEPKTVNQQRYADLAVEDISGKDAKGLLVTLDGLLKPARLIIGNDSGHGDGSFVRRPDDKQSWLASGRIALERDPAKWLEPALLDIGSERIAEIVLNKPDGNGLRVFKQQAGNSDYQVADTPAGRETAGPGLINGLASTLSGLILEDVASAQSLQLPDDSQLLKASYRRFDGVGIDVAAWRQDGKHYARFHATLDPAVAEAAIQSEQSKAQSDYEAAQTPMDEQSGQQTSTPASSQTQPPLAVGDPAKHRQQRLDELAGEVERLNQRLQGWYFAIPAYKYANMDKSINDVLKPLPAPNPPEAGPTGKNAGGKG